MGSRTPAPRERKKPWYAVGLPVAAALLLVALAPGWVTGWFGRDSGAGGGDSSSPAEPVTAYEGATQQLTVAAPVRGSPAARWANGTAGMRLPGLPEARATGWMSEPQVARTLTRSRDFLAASHLEPKMLGGAHPARAIELINPHQRDVQEYLKHAFREPGGGHDPLLLFSRFDRGDTERGRATRS